MPSSITEINQTDKSKKKIQSIAKSYHLDYDFVYYIFCFHWNYDGREGTWVHDRDIEKDDEYKKRYAFISNKLNLSQKSFSKNDVIQAILTKLKTIDTKTLNQNFLYGATTKNYCLVSEYASYHYLSNATEEKLNTLDWKSTEFDSKTIIDNLFFKLFRGGSIERYNLEYLYSDLVIDLPYGVFKNESEHWINDFIANVSKKRASMKLSDLITELKLFCKGDKYFLQTILESLSYSGILDVKNYSVKTIFIPDYRNQLAKHYNSNEWTFPLRFWNE